MSGNGSEILLLLATYCLRVSVGPSRKYISKAGLRSLNFDIFFLTDGSYHIHGLFFFFLVGHVGARQVGGIRLVL